MHVDPKSDIAGVPALALRDFLKRNGDYMLTSRAFAGNFHLPRAEGERIVRVLQRRGLIARTKSFRNHPDGPFFTLTLKGGQFALASGAAPVKRATAERALHEFLQRVHQLNASPEYLYTVQRVLLFGSYLTTAPTLNDVDLAVTLVRRPIAGDWVELLLAHAAKAETAGRRFASYHDKLGWAKVQVGLFLRNRSRLISLHAADEPQTLGAAHREIFAL